MPWPWGYGALAIDETALQARCLAISHLAVRWRDGAFTEFPGNARVESRRFELTDFTQGPRTAYLGLRRVMEDEANVLRYENIDETVQSRSRRPEEHTSELQSLMRISYAVFCLQKKNEKNKTH